MRYTKLGFPLPDSNDCAACTFGYGHNLECVGVDFGGTRVYYSNMANISEQTQNTLEKWLG